MLEIEVKLIISVGLSGSFTMALLKGAAFLQKNLIQPHELPKHLVTSRWTLSEPNRRLPSAPWNQCKHGRKRLPNNLSEVILAPTVYASWHDKHCIT